MKKKKSTWIKPRHTVIVKILYWPFYLFVKFRYHIAMERIKKQETPCLILYNHQTLFDQFIVSFLMPKHVYHVASEDLFSNGFISKLLAWAVAPIPFRKSASDISGIKSCVKVAKEGGNIAMAPEGNRTYSGTTEYMKSGVVSLVKLLKMPLVLYRIEGGYGVHPRWSDSIRKGKMRAFVARVVQPEEYAKMDNDELFTIIHDALYVDEREDKSEFYCKNNAEYLDRAMYYCPDCGLSEFDSCKDMITCKKCGKKIQYLPNKTLQGINCEFPYLYVKDWYDAQSDYVRALDMESFGDEVIYQDSVNFSESIYCDRKHLIDKKATLSIYKDRFVVDTQAESFVYPFADVASATALGRNKFNFYFNHRTFQFKGDKHFNPLKYLNLYFHAVNVSKGETNDEFLGL